jgi:hypothetical protein
LEHLFVGLDDASNEELSIENSKPLLQAIKQVLETDAEEKD